MGNSAPPQGTAQGISKDASGKESFNTVFGERQVSTLDDEVIMNVVYGKVFAKLNETVANGGTITASGSMLIAQTSTATNGRAEVETIQAVKYRPGHEFFAKFTALFTTGVAGANQFVGPFSDTDGFTVGYVGADFMVCRRSGGSDNVITQANFSEDKLDGTGPSGITLDPTKLNIYRITFGWLGIAPIYFQTLVNKEWITFHVIDLTNQFITPHIEIPYLPIRLEVIKTSGATNITARSASWNGGTAGNKSQVASKTHAAEVVETTIQSGVETQILSLRGKATISGIVNRIRSQLLLCTVSTDGAKSVSFKIYRDGTLEDGTWSDHDTDSVVEENTTNTIADGHLQVPFEVAKVDSDKIFVQDLNIEFHANESITITALSSGSNDISVGLVWREEH